MISVYLLLDFVRPVRLLRVVKPMLRVVPYIVWLVGSGVRKCGTHYFVSHVPLRISRVPSSRFLKCHFSFLRCHFTFLKWLFAFPESPFCIARRPCV